MKAYEIKSVEERYKNLSEKEIIRATVETVAENTVDGLIAPLFYAFVGACINVGGISLVAPLAMTYKAILQ